MRTHSIYLALAILVLCPFASAQWEPIGPPLINQYTFAVSGPGVFLQSPPSCSIIPPTTISGVQHEISVSWCRIVHLPLQSST
jgi:hypothetical protein